MQNHLSEKEPERQDMCGSETLFPRDLVPRIVKIIENRISFNLPCCAI